MCFEKPFHSLGIERSYTDAICKLRSESNTVRNFIPEHLELRVNSSRVLTISRTNHPQVQSAGHTDLRKAPGKGCRQHERVYIK